MSTTLEKLIDAIDHASRTRANELKIERFELDASCAKIITSWLRDHPSVKILNLSGCDLDEEICCTILREFMEEPNVAIETFIFDDCGFEPGRFLQILPVLSTKNTKTTAFEIRQNDEDLVGNAIELFLYNNPQIKELNLHGSDLNVDGARALGRGVQASNVSLLTLSDCELDDEKLAAFADAFHTDNDNLKALNLRDNLGITSLRLVTRIVSRTRLEMLDLSCTLLFDGLDRNDAQKFVQAVRSQCLSKLCIENVELLSNGSQRYIPRALVANNGPLQQLKVDTNWDETPSDDEGIVPDIVSTVLQDQNTNLKSLYLDGCSRTSNDLVALTRLLQHSTGILELGIGDNFNTMEGFPFLLTAMVMAPLKKLEFNFSSNGGAENSLKDILDMAKVHPTLEKLTLSTFTNMKGAADLILAYVPDLHLRAIECPHVAFTGKEERLLTALRQNITLVKFDYQIMVPNSSLKNAVEHILCRNQALARARSFLSDADLRSTSPGLLFRALSSLCQDPSGASAVQMVLKDRLVGILAGRRRKKKRSRES